MRVIALAAVATLTTAACKSDEPPKVAASGSAGSAAATRPATFVAGGRVLEVTGTVTVAGKPLAKGDTVAADAVVATGADGSVVIELAHNLVHFELGPNKQVKVNESLAWKQPKRTEPTAAPEEASTSAGRPVERLAADTTITAADPETAADKPVEKGKPPPKPSTGNAKAAGGSTESTKTRTIDDLLGEASGGKKTSGGASGGGGAQVSGSLDKEAIVRVIKTNAGRIRACYETALATNPDLEGKVVVKFTIGAGGKVTSATDNNSTMPDKNVTECVVKAVMQLKFPDPKSPVTISYPFIFKSA